MIVRDEAHVVEEALASIAPFLDAWVIVDTGSVDGTPDVVRRFFAERGIAGELHHRPWVDFGYNRSEALALCRGKADYVWVLDADDILVGTPDLDALGSADAYLLRYGTDFRYWRHQIFRATRPFRYVGVVHEHVACDDGAFSEDRLGGSYHLLSRRLGARNHDARKYERDAALLRAAVLERPTDARATFYLAQSLLDAGDVAGALEQYRRRAAMPGWDEESWCALFQVAACQERLGAPFEPVLAAYLAAWEARPARAEALVEAARWCRQHARWPLAAMLAREAAARPFPAAERLFVRADAYEWRALDELSIAAFYAGAPRESFAAAVEILQRRALPDGERPRVEANRDHAVPTILAETAEYPADLVRRLARRRRVRAPRLTLTITACRRLPLFERTVSSFLRCCRDVERVDRFVCIDDGSSAADRRRMRERFPFFEFVWKRPHQRGHARSMNLLRAHLRGEHWLHLEDDWHFFVADDYVSRTLAVLADDPDVAQVLFNRNYAETLADRALVGGERRATAGGVRYVLHQHAPAGSPALAALLAGGGRTNAWWPHYSLRPALLRLDAVRDIGDYDEAHTHFELDYAQRWSAAGYLSAFLDGVCCLHTGALTSDGSPGKRANAYALNGQPQFGFAPPPPAAQPDGRKSSSR